MKYTYIFSILLVISCLILPVCASNETPFIEKVSMYLYGDTNYVNGMPIPAGTLIVARDQFESKIGEYTMKKTGKYGEEYNSDKFEIGVWRNQSDKMNRTMPIRILFTIGGSPTKTILDFKQNEAMRFNIVSLSTENIVQVETTTKTTPLTPSTARTLSTPPIAIQTQTAIVTTPVLPIQTTQIVTQTPQQTQPPVSPNDAEDTSMWIYYGIVGTIIIVAAIIIAGLLYSYLMSKTSRDEVLHPDNKWK
jgi:hypothetical protein